MDLENKKFGRVRGPNELGGAADLIKQFTLWPHHEFFCKNSLPLSISETNYLRNVVGDTEIRKDKGMELNQLFQNASDLRRRNPHIGPFDLGLLGDAFHMRETARVDLPFRRGCRQWCLSQELSPKTRRGSVESKKTRVKRDKNRKHKHHHKDISSDKNKSKICHHDSGPEHLKKPQDKNRRYAGNGDFFYVHKQQNGQNPRRI